MITLNGNSASLLGLSTDVKPLNQDTKSPFHGKPMADESQGGAVNCERQVS